MVSVHSPQWLCRLSKAVKAGSRGPAPRFACFATRRPTILRASELAGGHEAVWKES